MGKRNWSLPGITWFSISVGDLMYFAVCSFLGHIMLLLLPQDFIVFGIGNRKMVPGLMRQTNKMMFHQSVHSV